jgi:hypothetical protein
VLSHLYEALANEK